MSELTTVKDVIVLWPKPQRYYCPEVTINMLHNLEGGTNRYVTLNDCKVPLSAASQCIEGTIGFAQNFRVKFNWKTNCYCLYCDLLLPEQFQDCIITYATNILFRSNDFRIIEMKMTVSGSDYGYNQDNYYEQKQLEKENNNV